MASARPSKFAGGGMLRGTDGVILDIQFSDLLADGSKPKPRPGKVPFLTIQKDGQEDGQGKPAFHSLFANLTIQEDGREKPTTQSLFAGGADDFEVAFDGHGVVSADEGNKSFGKSSGFYIFLASLVNPTNGDGFDENTLSDEDLDFTPIIGARCRFDQQVNEKITKKYGQRVSKQDVTKKFDRTDLIVTDYYGQVDVEVKAKAKGLPVKSAAGKTGVAKAKTAKAVDVSEFAANKVKELLAAAKNNTLNKSRLSVRLLTAIPQGPTRDAAQEWAEDDDNLASIDGTTYDAETETLTLD
jgi:hypothetical protein